MLPTVAALENSFHQRVGVATEAKIRLADAAFELLRPGESIFLDSSSTAYFLARRIVEGGLRLKVITNSGPVMQLLSAGEDPDVELFALGGTTATADRGPTWVRRRSARSGSTSPTGCSRA